MPDIKDLEKKIREEINKKRNLGEHAGGSGHLAFRSITKFNLGELKEITYKGKQAYEITCEYEIYTETEFLHPPENDKYYTEHYKDKFIFDQKLNILVLED